MRFAANRPVTSDYHIYRPLIFRTPVGSLRLLSKPGIFSWGRLDHGAAMLLRALREDGLPPGTRLLDLGCGNGCIGLALLRLQPELDLHLADASYVAYTAVSLSIERLGYTAKAWFSDVTVDIPQEQRFDVVVSNLPRGRLLAEQFLREAWQRLEPGGRLYISGARDTGILTRIATTEEWFGKVDKLGAIAGYRAARAVKQVDRPAPPASDYHEWREAIFQARGRSWHCVTKPGVFSWQHLDKGTARLLASLEVRKGERLLDLGCGAGQVGLVAAHLAEGVNVVMVDDSLPAVRAAERTARLNELAATVLPSDSASAVIGEHFDVVATNPPFHLGPGVEYDIATQFIEDARDILAAKGRLYLVCNTFIPYERQMASMFRRVAPISRDNHYKVLLGARPLGRCKKREKPPIVAIEREMPT